jgi:hypothetical protein
MSLWFSATAVAPAIAARWNLSDSSATWLTISVQLGFVLGALLSAVLNLSDRIAPPRLIGYCAAAGAGLNLAIALAITDELGKTTTGFTVVLGLRLATGVMLAGVYPPGMKIVASWFTHSRGLAIGIMVGALTIGSALPHLINAFPHETWWTNGSSIASWRLVLLTSSSAAFTAAIVAGLLLRTGPHLPAATRFDWSYFARVWADPAVRRANFGYLGHMFELYAMWTWAPRLILASYENAGLSVSSARVAGFATVAIGAIGCAGAGLMADRAGRCWTTILSLAMSGGCALVAGGLFHHPAWLTVVCLVWVLSVVAERAQFCVAVWVLWVALFVGTALTIQTCAGFLLTTLTIRAVPAVLHVLSASSASAAESSAGAGWRWALALLALGPAFGIYHMLRLWQMPAAAKMSSGNR